jgi:hypothetical protein
MNTKKKGSKSKAKKRNLATKKTKVEERLLYSDFVLTPLPNGDFEVTYIMK